VFALALLAAVVATPTFQAKPCSGDNADAPGVVCGEVRVPEDREKPGGRTIALNIVVLKALTTAPDLPPLVDLDGGPGLASTRSAVFYRTDGLAYRQRRDVILIDNRGTGGSNPLDCPGLAVTGDAFAPLYPRAGVAACRAALSRRADLRHYGTAETAADLDAVRTALGHERIDIVALSYGTTLALRYLAAFPARARAVVLASTVPASSRPPQFHAVIAEQALSRNFADCAADPACHRAFPDPDGDLRTALTKLGPVPPEIFLEKIRTMLYLPLTARQVPYVVHQAANGNLTPLRKLAGEGVPSGYFDGLYLAITCSESLALIDYRKAAAAARASRFGDYRLRRQKEACSVWPKARVPDDFLLPVSSSAAVLLVAGERDPVTPPSWAVQAAATLPNSRVMTLPWSAHSIEGLSALDTCYDPMLLQFFATANAAAVDAGCVFAMVPPPFKLGD
jgi:pimeloyl-ACP methyl ester carboxylesterase